MTKMRSNYYLAMGLALSLCIGALSSSITARAENTRIAEIPEKERGAQFCSRVTNVVSRITTKLTEHENKFKEKKTEREAKLNARFKERADKLAGRRIEWDKKRTEQYTKLEGKVADTDVKKTAITTFKSAIEAAVSVRRAAIDKAILDYQNGIKSAVESRKSSAESVVADFKSSVVAAADKAKADCVSGVNGRLVRDTLMTSLKTAREKLKADRQSIEAGNTEVKDLAAVRKQAFEKAIADFKATAEKARAELRVVFPTVNYETSDFAGHSGGG